jgi:hypothetical protein
MKLPRISIAWLMFGVAMLCVILGLLQNALNDHPILGEIGLWPTLTAFGTSSFWIAKHRGKGSPFLWGFSIVGWASILVYLAFCYWRPWLVAMPLSYYLNEVHYWWIAWLVDSDRYELYALNLLVQGLILSVPQFMMAALGGLIARGIWWKRWNTT